MERLSLEHPILVIFTYGEEDNSSSLLLITTTIYAINVDPIVRDAKTPKKVTIILTIKIANA